jgi:ZIP family zinc transporter
MFGSDPLLVIVIISVLGPIVGSAIGVARRPSTRYLCNMLCFAAGVMLAISFLELIPESIHLSSIGLCILGIVLGALVMYGLDVTLPHIHPELCMPEQGRNLKRTAIYLIVGIFLHNFPEGMAIAIGEVADTKLSIVIALAIAIHNIPEGICTAGPYYHTVGRRLKAFLVSASTAIPILIGFVVARYLYATISMDLVGIIIGGTAGLMIYISADELIPAACDTGVGHRTIFSLLLGVLLVIALEAL